jgi:NitT/TauT family transport system permease protein
LPIIAPLRTPVAVGWRPKLPGENVVDLMVQAGFTVFVFGMWEILSRMLHADFWISSPSAVVVAMIVLGWVQRLGKLFEPLVLSLYTLPKIALAPLFVLWFGIGPVNKIMFSAMLVFFMVFFTTFQGTRQVDRDLVANARLLGASRWAIWTKIAIPYASVWMFTGIRIGLPYALIGAIVGEFVAADSGVGFRIKEATSFFNTAAVFAGLVVLMAISMVLLGLLKLVERRVLRWQNDANVIDPEAAI